MLNVKILIQGYVRSFHFFHKYLMFNSKPLIDIIAPLVTILFIFLTTGCFGIYKWQCLSALTNVISLMNDNTKNNIIKNHY